MMVPEAANMPPTPWQTEILAPGIWAGADPRIRQSRPMLGPGDKRLPQPHQLLMISALASNG